MKSGRIWQTYTGKHTERSSDQNHLLTEAQIQALTIPERRKWRRIGGGKWRRK